MPKVSVIIPVYGVEKYIERCARSLFEQTLDDIEYLFIDDCTPDKSVEALKRVLEEYPNRKDQVIIHRMEQNSGQAAVRKWGMQNASGEYIIHCDSDDWVDTDMYRSMYEKAKLEESDIVLCDYYVIYKGAQTNTKAYHSKFSKLDIIRDILRVKASSSLWNKLVKKEIVRKIEVYPTRNMGEDLALCIQMLGESKIISYLPKPYYCYIIQDGSIVHAPDKVYSNFVDIVDNVKIVDDYCSTYFKGVFDKEIVALKSTKRDTILPIISQRVNYSLWINSFKEINSRILFNPYIPVKEKMRFVLAYIKIFKG